MDILHRVGVKGGSPSAAYDAVATPEGVASWWISDTTGDELGFNAGGIDIKLPERRPGERVVWEIAGGPDEWVGTHVTFDIKQEDDHTIVLFKHEDWKEQTELMYHCSTKWGAFMLSLKSFLETGKGSPAPDSIPIDNWG